MKYPIIDYEKTRKHLHILMLSKSLTARNIVDYLNLSTVRTVYKWYHPHGSLPCLEHLYAISVLLGVSINDIIIEKEPNSQADQVNLPPQENHPIGTGDTT